MKKVVLGFFILGFMGLACARESRKVEVLPPRANPGINEPIKPGPQQDPGPVPEVDDNNERASADQVKGDGEQSPAAIPPGSALGADSAGQGNPGPAKRYKFFYNFPTENRKDCLTNRGGTQVVIASCVDSADTGVDLKPLGNKTFHMVVAATGKCMVVNLKGDFRDPNGEVLLQGNCEKTESQNPIFSLENDKELTKITNQNLCLKIGPKGNLYLADCNVAWTWFSKSDVAL